MASETRTAGTGANDASLGIVAWTNPGNLTASDDARATADLGSSQTSQYLKATNFGFAIPALATITGIEVEWERQTLTGDVVNDTNVRIVKGGVIGGTNKSAGAAWSTTESFVLFGGAADLWGESWTDSDINASTFGAVLSVTGGSGAALPNTAQVDSCRITVHYTTSGDVVSPPEQMSMLLVPQQVPARRPTQPALSITEPTLFSEPPGMAWFRPTSEPVRQAPQPPRTSGVYAAEPSLFPVPDTVTVDKWFRETSVPMRRIRRSLPTSGALQGEPGTFVVIEEIFPDKWWQPTATPPRAAPRALPTVLAQTIEATIITIPDLDWLKQPSEPVREIPRAQPTVGLFVFDQGLLPPIFVTWYQPLSEPVRQQPRAQATDGDYPFTPLLVMPPWDWQQPSQVPQRRRRRAQPTTGALPIEAGQVANVELQWFAATAEPVREKPRAQPTTGQTPLEPSLLVIPPLDWLTMPPELPRAAPRAQATVGLETSHEQFEPTTFDVCVQMQPPVRRVARPQPTSGDLRIEESLYVTPDLDSWYRPLSLPVLPRQQPAALQPFTTFTIWIIGEAVIDVGLEWTAAPQLLEFDYRQRLHSKTPSAVRTSVVDFAGILEAGETLTGSPTVTVSSSVGAFAVDSIALSGTEAISFRVAGGRGGVVYELTFRCATSGGGTAELTCIIHVKRR